MVCWCNFVAVRRNSRNDGWRVFYCLRVLLLLAEARWWAAGRAHASRPALCYMYGCRLWLWQIVAAVHCRSPVVEGRARMPAMFQQALCYLYGPVCSCRTDLSLPGPPHAAQGMLLVMTDKQAVTAFWLLVALVEHILYPNTYATDLLGLQVRALVLGL